jgi:L-asparaginase
MSRVAVVFTGGTISMRHDAEAGGSVPALDGAGILALAPRLAELAQIDVVDWGRVSASHLRFADVLDIWRVASGQLERSDIDGAVIVQGTDAIEETAFAWDLLHTGAKPVVVTGAMRDASSPDYDGPRNLADGVRCATDPALRDQGVVVVMAGAILAADDVVKSHTTAMDTFRPRDGERLGTVDESGVHVARRRGGRRSLPRLPDEAVEDVYLISATMGMDGTLLRALQPLHPRGVVVAATGSGNTHPDLLTAAIELQDAGTTVVLTTRCPTGVVMPTYAFSGGGATWQRAGILASTLDGPKTRVALALSLAAGLDRDALTRLLAA